MATCRVCKIEKNDEEFAKKKTRIDGSILRNTICKPCQRIVSKEHYNDNKIDYFNKNKNNRLNLAKHLSDYKQKLKCKRCEFSGEGRPECIEFVRKDQSKRDYAVSKLVHFSMNKMMEEIEKCDPYCVNCNRILEQAKRMSKEKNE
jgi:hypothetical protein